MNKAQLQDEIAEAAIAYAQARWMSDKRTVASSLEDIERRRRAFDAVLAAEAQLLTAVAEYKQTSRAGAGPSFNRPGRKHSRLRRRE